MERDTESENKKSMAEIGGRKIQENNATPAKIPETYAEWIPDETVHSYALALCTTCGEYMYSEKQMTEHREKGHNVYINYAAP